MKPIVKIANRVKNRLHTLESIYYNKSFLTYNDKECLSELTLSWIRQNELVTGGIRVNHRHDLAYPEVTGYIVPTLLYYGERELANRFIQWLICIQNCDGSFWGPDDGKPYVFDTGQILRGLLVGISLVPEASNSARRAADYLCEQMINGGTEGFGVRYPRHDVPESVHLYVLPALVRAAEMLSISSYRQVTDRCLDYYCSHTDFLRIDDLTHFLAYQLDALIDLGRAELAVPILNQLKTMQTVDGAVRGKGGAAWVCSTGLAQLAICWYKIGDWEPADRAMAWLEKHQNCSGGFYGSYGSGASYFPIEEIAWATKFFLDANRLRILSFFERNAVIFPSRVSIEDGRMQAILAVIEPDDQVLEVGCGKGRFLSAIHDKYPNTICTGIDISPTLLTALPPDIVGACGSLEAIPASDNSADVVFSVEAIEHSVNRKAAIAEMIRVARPGGWVLVIDKQKSHWGRLQCPTWEHWPAIAEITQYLRLGCDHVRAEPVGFDNRPASDGMMVVWRGQKRSMLSDTEWNAVILSSQDQQRQVETLRRNQLTEWEKAVLLKTRHGERVLEIGSGTGKISLRLAMSGRQVTALDYSAESLAFIRRCAQELGVEITTIEADATQTLPFKDNSFDVVWSSGLLEHFTFEQRIAILRECARVTTGSVISLVPNAVCIAYRAGKQWREKNGKWHYGIEEPIVSQRKEYAAASMNVSEEFTVGAKHALTFLPENHPLRNSLASWLSTLSPRDLETCRQGYLLVTVGHPFMSE